MEKDRLASFILKPLDKKINNEMNIFGLKLIKLMSFNQQRNKFPKSSLKWFKYL